MSKGKEPVHLIMPHYNGKCDIIRAYMSITDRTHHPFILTMIDDGSSKDDPGYQFLQHISQHCPGNINVIFNEKNVGVTPNLNKGFGIYKDIDCVRLDADIEIQSSDWLDVMVNFMKDHPEAGVCGPLGVEPDFVTIQTAGQWIVISPEDKEKLPSAPYEVFDKYGQSRFGLGGEPIEVDSVLGCCAYYRRSVIDALAGVDEGYFGWVEDNDFCVGVRNLGFKNFILPGISYCHHSHAVKRPSDEVRKILENSEAHFIKKWGFSLYDPAPYWDDIKARYANSEILWRYKNEGSVLPK